MSDPQFLKLSFPIIISSSGISRCDNACKGDSRKLGTWYMFNQGSFSLPLQILRWVCCSPPGLQAPILAEAMDTFSTMARVSARRLEMGGQEQEKMLHGSELEGQCENPCEGILGTTEAPCIPLHKRKWAQRGPGTCPEPKDARFLGSASPHLRLSYRCKGEDSGSPSPSWGPLGGGSQEERY